MFAITKLLPLIPRNTSAALSHRYKFTNNAARQSNIMRKLLTKNRKDRKQWYDSGAVSKPTSFGVARRENKSGSRRVVVLNKLFMKYVTDLMATNAYSEKITGYGIEITRVLVCQNFHSLNVFWLASGNQNDDIMEKQLAQIAGPLRHELSQLQLMGEVPRITFVKDKKYSSLKQVDELLAIADYGEDHIPNPYGQRLKKEFEPEYRTNDLEESDGSTLPAMRNDVFGLDRLTIMRRIQQSLTKTKQAWETYESNSGAEKSSHSGSFGLERSFSSLQESRGNEKRTEQILNEFLQKRKLERKIKENKEFDARQLEINNDLEEHDEDIDENNYEFLDIIEEEYNNDFDKEQFNELE